MRARDGRCPAAAGVLAAALIAAQVAVAKTTLTVAVVWGPTGSASAGFEPVAEAFERLHPDVEVEFLWNAALADRATEAASTKVITMAAGGVPPDITMVGGQAVPQYAVQGLLMPLDAFIRSSGVRPGDFIPPAWRQTMWDGHVYAMTLQVDPNFALVWNQTLFAQAGLDTARGPATLEEWEAHFRKLTKIGPDGSLTHLGSAPWSTYGNANTVFTWSWVFGGQFYDYATRRVTAGHPLNVAAVEWLRDYHQRYATLPQGNLAFPNGNLGMTFAVTAAVRDWRDRFPDIPLGIGFEPYRAGSGSPNPSWIGGWAAGIMTGTDHPELAWELLHFMTATPEGTAIFARPSGWIPAYLRSPIFVEFARDPVMRTYLEIAQKARYQRPAMPVIADYMDELDRAFAAVLAGSAQPADALGFVQEKIQRRQDEVLAALK
ncbi:MAG TPA: extracellular solute-binding protein [Limnochordia bacterium]